MQHFVFLGPPGTGKTSVARVIAKIFYAFGLLDTPEVVEAQRADLVGEYLGATAIKTNELVDRALGGVLFIDEAYSLVNDSEGQGDRFGHEAVQALLKRAEDDRTELIIILAGYEKQMETFLASNPGLNSRFGLRVKFPSYSPAELMALAELDLEQRGEILDPDARPALWRMMEDIGRRRLADELGNGRFVRSLLEKAGRARDVRVMAGGAEPTPAELVTLEEADLTQAGAELTARFRGYTEAPTLENALAELDELVGLEPVKRQVHEIAAQLRVARLRERQGLASQPPVRHFVFTGPPGTGKTTVARILGRIFTALGLLVRPAVIEAHRADLVGEHLGSTAIKTGKLIDSALGGVLFIDEAYSLYNTGYSGGDAYGSEAVATLLKRAEDDRDRLVIVLAGYPADMDRFLRSNPGLASRFSIRIGFPSYSPDELCKIAGVIAEQHGDTLRAGRAAGAGGDLHRGVPARPDRRAGQRPVRPQPVRARLRGPRPAGGRPGRRGQPADLTTVSAADLRGAFRELAGPAPHQAEPTQPPERQLAPLSRSWCGERRGQTGGAGGRSRRAAIRLAGSLPASRIAYISVCSTACRSSPRSSRRCAASHSSGGSPRQSRSASTRCRSMCSGPLGRPLASLWSAASRVRRSAWVAGSSVARSMPPNMPRSTGKANARRGSASRSPSGSSRATSAASRPNDVGS